MTPTPDITRLRWCAWPVRARIQGRLRSLLEVAAGPAVSEGDGLSPIPAEARLREAV